MPGHLHPPPSFFLQKKRNILGIPSYKTIDLSLSILCLIPRTTVTSLSTSKETRCKTVIPGVPFWTREKTHKLRARWQASSSGICADVTVVLDVRQSIDTKNLDTRTWSIKTSDCNRHVHFIKTGQMHEDALDDNLRMTGGTHPLPVGPFFSNVYVLYKPCIPGSV